MPVKPAEVVKPPEPAPLEDAPEFAGIYEAMNWVMTQVGYVKKQRAVGLTYSFAGEAQLIAALRPAMVEAGIVCYVSAVDMQETARYQNTRADGKPGANMTSRTLRLTVRFVHAKSKTYIEAQSMGEAADSGDKAFNKAMTGAYKYALRQAFMIETGDDPDLPSRST